MSSLRRILLLGAAAIASVAALVAIAAVLTGDFGETEAKIFATLAATFVAGSVAIAGVALLGRGVLRPLGYLGVVLAGGGFVLWTEQIWAQHDSGGYWRFLLIVLAVALATLAATACRLMTDVPRLLRTIVPATSAVAALAAVLGGVMLFRGEADGWQLFAVLVILTVLGEILTPILDRYWRTKEPPPERPLATLNGIAVVAIRGRGGTVKVGDTEHRLGADEGVIVRPR